MSECNHCWHETGNMLTSNPPQYQLICCWCGDTKNVRALQKMEISKKHGDRARNLPIKLRKNSYMENEMNQEIEITPEQIAAYNQRMAEETRKQVEDASKQIAELAASLGVRIAASAQAVEIAPGVWGVAPVVAIEKVK